MKLYKSLVAASMVVISAAMVSCSDDNDSTGGNNPAGLSVKEEAFKAAAQDYVDHTVLPTYKGMADAAMELYDLCETMQTKHASGTLSTADVTAAGEAWKKSRKYWELSEAFLFGPAGDHNIDPHIDSWPLDRTAMDILLNDISSNRPWSIETAGYGLLGFHSIEYVLFELTADGNASRPHSTDYTAPELTYLVAVAGDLRDQCVCLEACWAGTDNVSPAKKAVLEEADLDYGEEYGWEMKNARQSGSRFKTFQAVAEEILSGCSDIADEVGNTKIGRPNLGTSAEDQNYIESPYSLNSIEDFADNIISIRNSYCGAVAGDKSISDYVKSINPGLDSKMRQAIEDAIAAIRAIPEPFTKTAKGPEAANAMKVVGTDLVDVIDEVYAEIVK